MPATARCKCGHGLASLSVLTSTSTPHPSPSNPQPSPITPPHPIHFHSPPPLSPSRFPLQSSFLLTPTALSPRQRDLTLFLSSPLPSTLLFPSLPVYSRALSFPFSPSRFSYPLFSSLVISFPLVFSSSFPSQTLLPCAVFHSALLCYALLCPHRAVSKRMVSRCWLDDSRKWLPDSRRRLGGDSMVPRHGRNQGSEEGTLSPQLINYRA